MHVAQCWSTKPVWGDCRVDTQRVASWNVGRAETFRVMPFRQGHAQYVKAKKYIMVSHVVKGQSGTVRKNKSE